MKTFSPKPRDIDRKWYVVDAEGVVLGRLAAHVATILRGKHKPIFAPHADTGDHVVVINARGVRVTGNKADSKTYFRHSGYPGGVRTMSFSTLMSRHPTRAIELAVKGMLPKNRLGREIFRKLLVYEGAEHPHGSQKPVPLGLGQLPRWEGLPKVEPVAQPAPSARPSARPRPPAEPRERAARTGARTAGARSKSTAKTTTRTAGRRTAASASEQKSTARRPSVRRAAERVTARRPRSSETAKEGRSSGSGGARPATSRAKSASKSEASKPTRGGRKSKKES